MARRKEPPKQASPDEPDITIDVSGFGILRALAYGIFLAVFSVAITFNGFAQMWALPSGTGETALLVVRVILFIELVILAIRWLIATHLEIDMWLRWLKNPLGRTEMYGAILSLSVVLGLLLAFPHKIVFISGFMTVYLLLNYWTQWLSNDHFDHALQETRKDMSKTRTKVLDARVLEVMEYFWLQRPQLGRIATTMFFSSIAFSLAFAGAVQQEPQRNLFQLSAYTVLILDILISEIVISWWRHKLDQGIRQAIDSKEGKRHESRTK